MGRIVLPVKLREQYGFEVGLECPLYLHEDEEGRVFVCIEAPPAAVRNLKEAMEIIKSFGLKVVQDQE